MHIPMHTLCYIYTYHTHTWMHMSVRVNACKCFSASPHALTRNVCRICVCQRCVFSMRTLTPSPAAHQCKGGLKCAHRKNLILVSTPNLILRLVSTPVIGQCSRWSTRSASADPNALQPEGDKIILGTGENRMAKIEALAKRRQAGLIGVLEDAADAQGLVYS